MFFTFASPAVEVLSVRFGYFYKRKSPKLLDTSETYFVLLIKRDRLDYAPLDKK